MIKVMPIVKKQKRAELEQIIMRMLEQEYEHHYVPAFNRCCVVGKLRDKTEWMESRIKNIYSNFGF
jgi:hypothetical protein